MANKEGLSYKGDRRSSIDVMWIRHIRRAAEVINETSQLELTEDEILYIANMLLTNASVYITTHYIMIPMLLAWGSLYNV